MEQENGPDEIVLVHGTIQAEPENKTVPDPVAGPQERYRDHPNRTHVLEPGEKYTGNGALQAAAAKPRAPAERARTLSIELDGETAEINITADAFTEALLSTYCAGGWDWVQRFLLAVGRPVLSSQAKSPVATARNMAIINAIGAARASLNDAISKVLVELAERAFETALELSAKVTGNLLETEKAYGIRLQPAGPAVDTGAGGAQGGPGTDPPKVYEVHEPQDANAAPDLLLTVGALLAAYTAYEGELVKLSPVTNEGSPGPDPYGAPPPPPPDPKVAQEALKKYTDLLKASILKHRIAAGVVALCLDKRKDSPGQLPTAQSIYASTVEYVQMARESLKRIGSGYDSGGLRESMSISLASVIKEFRIAMADTPETRAAVFSGRSRDTLEPLLADQLLERVRADIVGGAKESGTDEDGVRALFALSVLNSYLAVSDARDALPKARAARDQEPFEKLGKTSAALSLVGLFAPPLQAAAAVTGLYAMYGSAVNQFAQIARESAAIDTKALDALLAEDHTMVAQTLASKPRGLALMSSTLETLVRDGLLAKLIPPVSLAYPAVEDALTLLE